MMNKSSSVLVFLVSFFLLKSVKAAEIVDMMSPQRDEIMKQIEGNYTQMRKDITPLGLIQSAWDKASSSSGMRTVQHQQNRIIKMQLRRNMVTSIILPQWENINQWIIGLSDDLIKVQKLSDNIIALQPFEDGVDTNLHIVGKTGTVYAFYIRTESNNTKNITDQQIRILFEEPEESINKREEEKEAIFNSVHNDFIDSVSKTWLRENKFDISKIRHDLTMYGDSSLAPFAIFRDDKFIFIDWGINHEEKAYPVVYQVVDGINNPVSIRKTEDGRFMIVESINNLALVYGKKVVCIKRAEK